MTNVTDDLLEKRQPEQATSKFQEAESTALTHLGGFDKAKIQFAAYEGLAKAALLDAGLGEGHGDGGDAGTSVPVEQRYIQAVRWLTKAEEVARTWFEPSGRRFSRVKTLKENLKHRLAGSGLEEHDETRNPF